MVKKLSPEQIKAIKRKEELKKEYKLKETMLEGLFPRLDAATFYSELFVHIFEPKGLDCRLSTGLGNPIVVSAAMPKKSPKGKIVMQSRIVTEDERTTFADAYKDNPCALIAPVPIRNGRKILAHPLRWCYTASIERQ